MPALTGRSVPASEPPLRKAPCLFIWDASSGLQAHRVVPLEDAVAIPVVSQQEAFRRTLAWLRDGMGLDQTR